MHDELINFILAHETDDLSKLLLKQKEILGYPASFVANQINGRRKAKEKLPTWYANPSIVYPPQQNLEQCSSEATARFKSEVMSRSVSSAPASGGGTTSLADLTGGFGIDSFFFSKIFSKTYHAEPDAELCRLAERSHALLSRGHASGGGTTEYIESTAEEFISRAPKLDWIYLDPSRRSKGKKVFRLSDSQPDVVSLLPELFSRADNILIKTSPLLDLKEGMKQLPKTKEIFVVSVGNECKEVLFRLEKNWTAEPEIICVNLVDEVHFSPFGGRGVAFRFKFSEEAEASADFSEPLLYLYEPNASILKAGAFKSIAKAFNLFKISPNTHLYTSKKKQPEFPGRIFQVQSPPAKRGAGLFLGEGPRASRGMRSFNIISRNHPITPEQIKKKFKLKDGGEKYVLAFSGRVKKYLLVAERVK